MSYPFSKYIYIHQSVKCLGSVNKIYFFESLLIVICMCFQLLGVHVPMTRPSARSHSTVWPLWGQGHRGHWDDNTARGPTTWARL